MNSSSNNGNGFNGSASCNNGSTELQTLSRYANSTKMDSTSSLDRQQPSADGESTTSKTSPQNQRKTTVRNERPSLRRQNTTPDTNEGNYTSLFCLSEKNRLRRVARIIANSKIFDYFILVAILINCIVLAMDAPLPENDQSEMNSIALRIEYYLLGIFCFEAVVKITAMGFVLHPKSYLRSGWNVIDFLVVITGIITLENFIIGPGGPNIKSLRAIRVLRPLKLISGIPSLQVVMTSLVRAMFPLLQVLYLVVFVIVIYAIIGLEFLKGRFHYTCFDSSDIMETNPKPCDYKIGLEYHFVHGRSCPTNYTCQRYWIGPFEGITSYDNIFLAMITVFQSITEEGWTDIMYLTFYSIDQKGYVYSFYFISLIVIGSFLMLNLVLGVLSGEFAKERQKVENRRMFLKLRQERQIERICEGYMDWIIKGEEISVKESQRDESNETDNHNEPQDIILNPAVVFTANQYRFNTRTHRKHRYSRIRRWIKMSRIKIRSVVKSHTFYWLVILIVFLNTVVAGTSFYNQPQWLTDFQGTAEVVFIGIFTFELLLKFYGLGIRMYFASMFNTFDCIIVALSVVEKLLMFITDDFNIGISVFRSLRLLRIFKITKYWSSLRNLVSSLMNGMKSILSLMFLLLLFIVISGLLGMQLFGGRFAKFKVFPRTNFDSFPDALLAVFQIMTGEDWNSVMQNGVLAYGGPASVKGVAVSIYFIFLVIFGNYTLLNVFLAIAVDNLTNAEILSQDEEMEKLERLQGRTCQPIQGDWARKNALEIVNQMTASRSPTPRLEPLPANEIDSNENETMYHEIRKENGLNIDDIELRQRNDDATNNHVVQMENDRIKSIPSLAAGVERNGSNRHTRSYEDISQSNGMKIKPSFLSPAIRFRSRFDLYRQSSMPDSEFADGNHYKLQRKWQKIANAAHLQVIENQTTGHPALLSVQKCGSPNGFTRSERDEGDGIHHEIRRKGLLSVMKMNVTERRKINNVKPINKYSSLFIFSPQNRLRQLCHRIVNYKHFDHVVIFVIILSSITLAVEDPVNDDAHINRVMYYFDCAFAIVFGIEVLLKIIDSGLILHKGSYFRDEWNILDAFVLACNLASIIIMNQGGTSRASQAVKALRVLRVFRPLKAIHKVKKLKAVFQCMIFSLKNVTFVLIITLLFLFIFACIGVQLFQGKFFYCKDASKVTREECHGKYYEFPTTESVLSNEPNIADREWKQYDFHFDNVLEAMLTLFTSSTGEGWPSSMHQTIDATVPGRGPIRNNKPHMSIYFVSFVIVFTFMILNIYVALIILTFQREGEKEMTEGGLERNERDCIQYVLNAKPKVLFIPKNKRSFSYHVWYVVDSKAFEYFITVLIILNTIQLMMQYDGSSDTFDSVLQALNISFTVLFCIEAILKIIAYRMTYFRDPWNLFDLAVILGSVCDIILINYAKNVHFVDSNMFRLCRAARIIKLLRIGSSIRLMLWTFLQSFKALPYVMALILLLFYMYAVIGMQLFGKIKVDDTTPITEYNNFRTIIQALQILFRSATGESWNTIMRACYNDAKCDDAAPVGIQCGNKYLAIGYFCSFIFLCMFLMLNLFVAVIMDNFEYLTRDSSILGPHHLDEFIRYWSKYDPQGSGKIPYHALYQMLTLISPPAGFGKKCPRSVAYKRLIRMNMPVHEDQTVNFHSTLFALVRTTLNIKTRGNHFENDNELRRIIKVIWPKVSDKMFAKVLPKRHGSDTSMTVGKVYCCKLLAINYRAAKMRKLAENGMNFRGILPTSVESINL